MMLHLRRALFVPILALAVARAGSPASAQSSAQLSPDVKEFVTVDDPVVVLNHVRVIDGTGAAARPDQAVVIRNGKIAAMGASAATKAPDHARVLDLSGYTVIP